MVERRRSRVDRRKASSGFPRGERRSPVTPEIHILIETREPNAVITLIGPITIDNGNQVQDAIVSAQQTGNITRVIVKLDKVAYIDTAGFGIFLELRKRLCEKKKELVLVNPSEIFMKFLDLLNLKNIFDIRELNIRKEGENEIRL